ncbi:HK97 family phage prohead protease [Thalassotalea sp. SU-HH00458]|uniref:HK97 family phage prohead protease n=1 Tax=Thalassotalea sp. SU-HH00458 TaxID=3127657 RepID=UPI0031050F78
MTIERRAVTGLSAKGKTLKALAIPYNSRSQDMGFIEMISPNAFDLSGDVKALYEHDKQHLIGRTTSNTLRLNDSIRGIEAEIDLPNTSMGNDLAELVQRGDISGMSFGFIVENDEWDYNQEPALRTITKASLKEVTVTSDPAYLDTNVVISERALSKANKIQSTSLLEAELALLEVI